MIIRIQNHLGKITVSEEYFTSLIGSALTGCLGVVSMNAGSAKQMLLELLPFFKRKRLQRGVTVRTGKDKLIIDLHISVMYGVSVGTVVKSIMNKVRYVVQEGTGIAVEKVNVYVDTVKTD